MTKDFNDAIIRNIQEMYKGDPVARRLFDWAASCLRDASETTLDRLSAVLRISRGEAVSLAKKLQDAGCGDFVLGRRGSKSRFVWAHSRISLGQAASGKTSELEAVTDPVADDEQVHDGNEQLLTISQAKLLLAKGLGVDPENIEITVKA